MKKKNLFCMTIIIIVTIILAILGYIYNINKINFKAMNIGDVKSVKLFPFQGANPIKEYNYDIKNPNDKKVINNIVSYLNSGKSLGVEKRVFAMNGGTPSRLVIELTDGKYIELRSTNLSQEQVLVSLSSTNKTYKFYSPELVKLFVDELHRIFNS